MGVSVMTIELDVERIKSWYVGLTMNNYSEEQAIMIIAQAIRDGILAVSSPEGKG